VKNLTKADKIVVLLIVLLACFSHFFFVVNVFDNAPQQIEISVGGQIYATYSLNKIKDERIVNIDTEYGNNTLKISPDGAEMIDASCSDKLDIRVGKITKEGQAIICVPNKVMVKLVRNNKEKVDKVTY
jgi:hypothetical protein